MVGFIAVLLWALLALFTVGAGPVPPFLLTALCFALGGALGLVATAASGRSPLTALRQPWKVWLVGVGGLFGYHFFYFTALQNAPPAEAGLIAYLWPLLIVLLAALGPGERLRSGHVIGALLGFAGAAVILGPAAFALTGDWKGYGAAILCAALWSGYSVLSRYVGDAPTDSVAGFCLGTAALAGLCHLLLEETVWPAGALEWASVIGLGLGPVGAAFYVWDIGCKRGDLQLLGVLAYAAPLLSTLILVVAGVANRSDPTMLGVASLLIVIGSLIAARASIKR